MSRTDFAYRRHILAVSRTARRYGNYERAEAIVDWYVELMTLIYPKRKDDDDAEDHEPQGKRRS